MSSGHRLSYDLGKMLQASGGSAWLPTVTASSTLDLRGRGYAKVRVTATCTVTLPDVDEGTEVLILCDDTSVVTIADSGGTVASLTGTSGTTAARCTATDSNSWAVEIVGVTAGGAAEIGIADAGNYTAGTDVEAALQGVMREAFTIRVPMTTFVDADGDPLAKWADNASPNPGFNLANSEAFGIRWNDNGTQGQPVLNSVVLPLSVTADKVVTMNIIASKVGATVGDATTFTVTAFVNAPDDLHDGGSNIGGVSSAMTGNATSKTVQHETLALTMPDISGPATMTFTITPTSGTLSADDVIVHGIYFSYPN
jgi:hypothetical protein